MKKMSFLHLQILNIMKIMNHLNLKSMEFLGLFIRTYIKKIF